MLPVQEALKIIRKNIEIVGIEDVFTVDALNRIVAEGSFKYIKNDENS